MLPRRGEAYFEDCRILAVIVVIAELSNVLMQVANVTR